MPLTPTQIALLGVGTNIATAGLNYAAATRNNRMQLAYNREMYDRQRADALSDYNMQNQYNSPMAQMARFSQAGLNPNLIYKQSNEGGTVRSTDAKSYNPTAPKFESMDVANIIAQSQQSANIQAQTDLINERVQTEKLTQQLKQWDALMKPLDYASKETKNYVAGELAETQVEAGKQGLNQLLANIKATTERNERENQLQPGKISIQNKTIDAIAENILYTKTKEKLTNQQIQNLQAVLQQVKTSTELQQTEIDLRKKGFSYNDPYYIRVVADKTLDVINEGLKRFGEKPISQQSLGEILANPIITIPGIVNYFYNKK